MSKIAVDVAILLPEEIEKKAIELNRALDTKYQKIMLDKENTLTHITLCRGVLDEKYFEEAKNIISDITNEISEIELTATNIKSSVMHTGEEISEITIAKTQALLRLHDKIMTSLKHLLTYDATTDMLYSPPEPDEGTLQWIRKYKERHGQPEIFNPHITLGIGKGEDLEKPLNFTATRIALCQLGNYCTCKKVFKIFELK